MPYQPFVEALGGYLDGAPEAAMRRLDEGCLRELSRVLPQIRARIPTLASGYLTSVDLADTAIAAGRADLCLLERLP